MADPDALSAQLVLLYDGSMIGAQLDRDATLGQAAQAAALIDAAHPAFRTDLTCGPARGDRAPRSHSHRLRDDRDVLAAMRLDVIRGFARPIR